MLALAGSILVLGALVACQQTPAPHEQTPLLVPSQTAAAQPAPEDQWWQPGCGIMTPRKLNPAIKDPVLIHRVPPNVVYPGRNVAKGVWLIVETIVDTNGNVCAARIQKRRPGPEWDQPTEQALEAIRQWTFRPALDQGGPVPVILPIAMTVDVKN